MFLQIATVVVNNSDVETTLLGAGRGTLTIPANEVIVGTSIRVRMGGVYGSKGAAPGTLTINVLIGGVSIGTHIETLNANETNQPWELVAILSVRTIGAAGTIQASARWLHEYAQGGEVTDMGDFGVIAVATVDTTAPMVIDVTADFSAADAANTITATNCCIEIMGF